MMSYKYYAVLVVAFMLNYQTFAQTYLPITRGVTSKPESIARVSINQKLVRETAVKMDSRTANGKTVITGTPGAPTSFYSTGDPTIDNFPWHCGVYVNEKYVCNCAFLSNSYVITAAQCFRVEKKVTSIKIIAKTADYTSSDRTTVTVASKDIDFFGFDNGTLRDNIAGIQLSSSVSVANILGYPSIKEIATSANEGKSLTFVTWGADSATSPIALSSTLKVKTVEIASSLDCAKQWGTPRINDEVFCINCTSAECCYGDQGGVLLQKYSDKYYYPVGVISIVPVDCKTTTAYTIATALKAYYGAVSVKSDIAPRASS